MSSFEPDPQVAQRVQSLAGRLAEQAIDLADDGKQLLDELKAAMTDVKEVCEPGDFIALVLDHLPTSMRQFFPAMGVNVPEIINSLLESKERGEPIDARVEFLSRIDPAMGAGAAYAAQHRHMPGDRVQIDLETPRTAHLRKLIETLLERETGTVSHGGHKWLLCQIVLRSGYRFTGAMRKHESELLQMTVDGKTPTGDLVQLEHYFDYDDIETIAQPVTAAPASKIVTG